MIVKYYLLLSLFIVIVRSISINSGPNFVANYGSFTKPTKFSNLFNSEDNFSNQRTLDNFTSRDSRQGFMRKVYSVFSFQMISTILIVSSILKNAQISNFLLKNYNYVSAIAFIVSTGVVGCLVHVPDLRYKAPVNLILLGVHTTMQSILMGVFSTLFDPNTILVGTMHTLFTFLAVTLYSFQPNKKLDLTMVSFFTF
jgi:FtsH-binding integral membrane protein